jgi:hypothetical protein
LNLKCDILVSKFAFIFNLYRYSLELGNGRTIAVEAAARGHADVLRLLLAPRVGGCTS